MELNINSIRELIECLEQSSLERIKLETSDFKLTLVKSSASGSVIVQTEVPAAPAQTAPQIETALPVREGNLIMAPIVGTFYEAASPEKPPFVKAGQQVKRGDVLFIIESMKLMNEITSELDGTVAEILVKNGQGVEFGQPILRIV